MTNALGMTADQNPDLEASTAMFGKLADPKGPNNALSQVLYGLALRYDQPFVVQLPRHHDARGRPVQQPNVVLMT